jgi:hypothetical protein
MPQFSIVRGQFTCFEVRLCRPERLSDHVGRGFDRNDRDLHVAPINKLLGTLLDRCSLGDVEGGCVLIMWGCIVETGCVGDNIVWNVLVCRCIVMHCYDCKYTGLYVHSNALLRL